MAKQEIRALTKTDMVVERVIHMIVEEHYKPGDKLPPEGFYIENYGVSRVTVREAFNRLSSMGVVTVRQGDGTFVNPIKPFEIKPALLQLLTVDEKSVEDLYDTRICIEQHILDLVKQASQNDVPPSLREIVQEMDDCLAAEDPEQYSKLDHAFHDELSRLCNNAIIQSIYESLASLRRIGIQSSNTTTASMRQSQKEHLAMIKAMEKNNLATAKEIMKQHLNHSKEMLMEALKQQNHPRHSEA